MNRALVLMMSATSLLTAEAVVEGNPKSPVRVVAYEDLQCGDCAVYRRMLDEHLLPKFGATVAFEHRDFPLPKHKWARNAAILARHFDAIHGALGIEFRRWLYSNIPNISPENFNDKVSEWAKAHGQDPGAAVKALSNGALSKLVEDDYQEGIARGVARTPTVLVNGEPFIEPSSPDEITAAIQAALAASQPKK